MPLYEYECTQCEKHTERIQKFSDPEITTCPHCKGSLVRVISAAAISFKGGGWFKDGYGNAKPSTSNSETKTESGSSAESSTSGDSSSKESSSGKESGPTVASNGPAPTTTPSPSTSSSEKQ